MEYGLTTLYLLTIACRIAVLARQFAFIFHEDRKTLLQNYGQNVTNGYINDSTRAAALKSTDAYRKHASPAQLAPEHAASRAGPARSGHHRL